MAKGQGRMRKGNGGKEAFIQATPPNTAGCSTMTSGTLSPHGQLRRTLRQQIPELG